MKPMKIGIIGCGVISGIYLKMLKTFPLLETVALADLIPERSQGRAAEFGIPRACTNAELLADPEIEIVLNLTTPDAHASVALDSLQAGKSVYNEKPLAIHRAEAQHMLQLAAERGLRVGGAPDTFLGAGQQTCRKVIDDGLIGTPVAATAFMTGHGHESWHPAPEFYYKVGAGPMFDMGPYYVTALVNLLGPARRVTGSAQISFPQRTITSQPKNGQIIDVEVPTHVAGLIDFAGGAVATIITSFDIWRAELPRIEIYGSLGTLSVPDPNTFGGPVRLWRAGAKEWEDVPLLPHYGQNWRSLGVADMAHAIRAGRPHRAGGELTYHVLDIMHAFHDASAEERHIRLQSTCPRPAPLQLDLPEGTLD